MKAVIKEKPGYGIKWGDAAVPKAGPGEILVRVEVAGICGSDLHIYEWTPGYEAIAPYFPRILGHEFSGEVVSLGEGLKGEFKPGDKVTSETCKSCGQCFYCKKGNGILCLHRFVSGRIGFERDGAMAEYVVVSEECVHRIPAGVTMEEAAMTEPAAVALGAVERGGFDPGDLVVISGPGPIGLMALQFCKALGAGRVVVVGLEADQRRLEVATKLGADAVLTGSPAENLQKITDWTGGLGAATVFEISGAPAAAAAGLQMLRRFGDLVLVGIYPEVIPVDATRQMVRQMKTIKGSYGGASLDWDRVLNLVSAGRIRLKPLISDTMPLQDAQEGLEKLRRKEALKVLLKP
jgi:L-iditol 2-dehydrogenase